MRNTRLETIFPNLRPTGYEITSQESTRYNCVGWALHDTAKSWWPRRGYFWPEDSQDESVEEFIRMFTGQGYEVCAKTEHEEGYEKIAIYCRDGTPSHVARQLPSGLWTSKCGDYHDITHSLDGFKGSSHGEATVIMRRSAR